MTKRVCRLWTTKEIEYLKANYAKYSSVDMAKQLGRTINSMYGKACLLGLRKDPGIVSLIAMHRESNKATIRDTRGRWINEAV